MADGKIDPFDVAALERAVNDSAGRVSSIWLSFVAFSAYLAAAASMISHRQIFLEEPIKLPTINIDVPLVAAAILMPLLFVIYHVYVLLQVVLLARTACAYNMAVEHCVSDDADRTLVRQRLGNTLFAQIFAGSPREREGVLGGLLRAMVWITLAIGPVLVLLLFQVKFLPYQSAAVTWAHRALFAFDLLNILLLWSAAVNIHRDVTWQALVRDRTTAIFASVAVLISVFPLTYPGEPHTTWVKTLLYEDRYNGPDTAECRMPKALAALLPRGFDRLVLSGASLIDIDRLARIEKATIAQKPHEGERTRFLAGRNFNCAILTGADLRRADWTDASLIGALLEGADLRGSRFSGAILRKASLKDGQLDDTDWTGAILHRAELTWAKLPRANFQDAHLERALLYDSDLTGAVLESAHLQGSNFLNAKLIAATFYGANLKGATLEGADLRGANLSVARLQATRINGARLEGADLSAAKMSGARLYDSHLQGAYFESATVDGVDFTRAQIQGANFHQATLTLSTFDGASLWRTLWGVSWDPPRSTCDDAHLVNPNFESILSTEPPKGKEPAKQTAVTAESLGSFVEGLRATFPKQVQKDHQFTLDQLLTAQPDDDTARQSKAFWLACAEKAKPEDQYEKQLVTYLIQLACAPGEDQEHIAEAMYSFWIDDGAFQNANSRTLARGLIGLDGAGCPGSAGISAYARGKLQEIATATD